MFVFSYFVVFKVMGKDYDAAVMTSGFIGFAMGATSNAMVGSLFIDFLNAIIITGMLGMLS